MRLIFIIIFIFVSPKFFGQLAKPYGPVPTKLQLDWHEMEFYLFIHFGPNTFTDKEWGHGDEPANLFNPTELDCRQWCRIAKAAGAKGIIITAKHHDGFCLWPSKYSTHTVRESRWKNGKGDVLKDLSAACTQYGLKFGVYISPWDRNHPQYGTPEYNDVFVNMMKEIFSNYGPVWELWWDGANGEGPNGKRQVYDWGRFKKTVKTISPSTVVFSDVGPQVRWVGNEKGIAGETNWNLLDTVGFTPGEGGPPVDTLNKGNIYGNSWIPAECDVSIRPGWFYHAAEDNKVKSPSQLFELYLKSVGRGANFLLNVPPDRRGLIHPNDSASLISFRKLQTPIRVSKPMLGAMIRPALKNYLRALTDKNRATFVSLKKGDKPLEIGFMRQEKINCIELREAIQFGQRVIKFKVILTNEDSKVYEKEFTTIGRKRLITFPAQTANFLKIEIIDAKDISLISEVAAYLIDEKLVEK